MLNQEKECSNLELSKKLKELGVLQESKFLWFKNYFPDGYLKKGEWELVSGKPLFQKDETAVCDNDCYSAYTIGELGEMLPKAGVRAEMLIYLIENNYITVEEINKKLKKLIKKFKDMSKEIKWSELTREQKLELIEFCDSLFIPPNFVKDMYESGAIDYEFSK